MVRCVPICGDAVDWPSQLRLRISAMVLDDKMRNFFVVVRNSDSYHVGSIPRERAEPLSRKTTGRADKQLAEDAKADANASSE